MTMFGRGRYVEKHSVHQDAVLSVLGRIASYWLHSPAHGGCFVSSAHFTTYYWSLTCLASNLGSGIGSAALVRFGPGALGSREAEGLVKFEAFF